MQRVDYGVLRSGNFKGCQRSRIIGNLRSNSNIKGITGISLGINQRHINPFFVESGGALEITGYPVFLNLPVLL